MGGGVYPVCPECLYRLSSAPSQPVSKENKKKSHVNQPTTYGSCKKYTAIMGMETRDDEFILTMHLTGLDLAKQSGIFRQKLLRLLSFCAVIKTYLR